MDSARDLSENTIRCGICGHTGIVSSFETIETNCIFDGGKLVRYICPDCGAIFGPIKFSRQTKEQFDDDYTVHYTGYKEGDSTEKEIRAFQLLKPKKEGVYLNYGCGSWSDTMKQLESMGYNVYGYEPFSKDYDNPKIISDRIVLSRMRFNGIFSNDVLEHLPDPIADLSFMKTLLATPRARMSHCTGCYKYKNEYTRFHMFFFTGRSMDVICERTGLKIEKSVMDDASDFNCRVLIMRESTIDYMPLVCMNEMAKRNEQGVYLERGGIAYGPYITLPPGRYKLDVSISLPTSEKLDLAITADSGARLLKKYKLLNGGRRIVFTLAETSNQVEFVLRNNNDTNATLTRLELL